MNGSNSNSIIIRKCIDGSIWQWLPCIERFYRLSDDKLYCTTQCMMNMIEQKKKRNKLKTMHDVRTPATAEESGLTNAALYKQRRMPVPSYLNLPLFRHLHSETSAANDAVEDDPILLVPIQLAAATAIDEAFVIVSNEIRLKLSKLLSMAADDIDPGKSISSNGVDSLVATEFRTWLAKTLKADLPMIDIMGTSGILTFSEKVVGLSKLVQIASSS
ncbi:hypothetical protein N5P37_009162 [Trichoderma harzianum]|uniref:Carrier domain-containing protein n=1 Tax=Trichoderma harzianum CBS 226.95 TaxID=983964 RepID=A0A2T4A967_TRIHA|nr:hypothetical protein M431DRAFT_483603 [Trichoderma harzianum CBS 226.95]KAK0757870.1 hypothetical protein N5P37_009162 [Trichoderma harzianum]PTB53478.1 hypothetical protein M431DRAFT_483603 [Trichoderma harzianum CBS 226.95]